MISMKQRSDVLKIGFTGLALLCCITPEALSHPSKFTHEHIDKYDGECDENLLDRAAFSKAWSFYTKEDIRKYNDEQKRRQLSGETLLPLIRGNSVDTGFGAISLTGPNTYFYFARVSNGRFQFRQSTNTLVTAGNILSIVREIVARNAQKGDCRKRLRDNNSYAAKSVNNEIVVTNSFTFEKWACERVFGKNAKTRLWKTTLHQNFAFKPVLTKDYFNFDYRVKLTQYSDVIRGDREPTGHGLRKLLEQPIRDFDENYNFDDHVEIDPIVIKPSSSLFDIYSSSRFTPALDVASACGLLEEIRKQARPWKRKDVETRYKAGIS